MFFKKKEKPQVEIPVEEPKTLSAGQIKILKRMYEIYKEAEQYESYKNQKIISAGEYQREMQYIMDELDELERTINEDKFDEMMGRPMDFLEAIFKGTEDENYGDTKC